MPLDGQCPDCGEALKPRARKCSCGWAQAGRASLGVSVEYRCEWSYLGQRCRYPATSSHGTLGHGPWYCSGHFGADGVVGQRIVEESQQIHIPDYSPQALVAAAREAYLKRPIRPRQPGEEG